MADVKASDPKDKKIAKDSAEPEEKTYTVVGTHQLHFTNEDGSVEDVEPGDSFTRALSPIMEEQLRMAGHIGDAGAGDAPALTGKKKEPEKKPEPTV